MAWQQWWSSKWGSSAGSWELGAGRISGRSDCDDRDELIVLGEGGEGGDERRGEERRGEERRGEEGGRRRSTWWENSGGVAVVAEQWWDNGVAAVVE